jgi:acetyltransferase-like isoleucine patch superfamily enzyme/lysophospholipase L1-like esterase
VALGDSITYGEGGIVLGVDGRSWALWLAQALDLPYTNYAVCGARAGEVVEEQLPRVRREYDVGALYVGVNDARDPAFDPAAFDRDVRAAAAGLAPRCARLLLLTVPLDLGRPRAGAEKVGRANSSIRAAAAAVGATVVALEDLAGWRVLLPDAVHPTAPGQLEIADRAARALGAGVLPSARTPPEDGLPVARFAAAWGRMWAARGAAAEGRVRRPRGVERAPGARVGRGAVLDARGDGRIVLGPHAVVGERCQLRAGPGATLVVEGALGERCRLVAAASIVVEAGARLGAECVVLDADPVFDDVERPVREQGVSTAPTRVGAGAQLGPRVAVLAGVTVGAGACVLAHSVCTRDVPAGARAGGTPARS